MSAKDESKSPEPAPLAAGPGQPSLLVLHIDDSPDDQVLFQTACKHANVPFMWHVADSAEKAISYLESLLKLDQKHSVRWPDLVVLDVVMPGESGLRVLEHIRATPGLAGLPVVIFSAHLDPTIVEQARKLGADAFVAQPLA